MINIDDFLVFSDRTFDGYRRALGALDDSTINALPSLPNANSPYQLVIHALAATEWWSEHIVLGLPIQRDRDAEFESSGTVAKAGAAVDAAQARLHELGPQLGAATELANAPQTQTPLAAPWTVGTCMIHVYEELAQHLGHLEITVDLASGARHLDPG